MTARDLKVAAGVALAAVAVFTVTAARGVQRAGFAQRVEPQKAPLQSETVSRVTGPRATLQSAIAPGATATVTLQPVAPKTQPPSSYPPGSTIVGQTLTLLTIPPGGQRVWFEILATNWAPQTLKTFQGTLSATDPEGIGIYTSQRGV